MLRIVSRQSRYGATYTTPPVAGQVIHLHHASTAAGQTQAPAPEYEMIHPIEASNTTLSKPSRYPPSSAFAAYTTSISPTPAQLHYANRYFLASKPCFLSGASKFRTLPISTVPEVAFLGRSNVGKSSLLNALVQRTGLKIANISSKPGRTREMNAFGIGGATWVGGRTRPDGTKEPDEWMGRGGIVVLDMPGYGKASQEDWGKEIMKYLSGRKQLRRTFVLIDGEHGVKKSDMGLLEMLRQHGIAHQVVLSKIDKVLMPRGKVSAEAVGKNLHKLQELFEETKKRIVPEQRWGPRALEDVITCSAEKDVPMGSGNKLGIDNLRWAVLSAAGLDCDREGNKKRMDYEMQE